MEIYQALILSIVEGITEFLPVSSTGHMILTADLLQIPDSDFLKSFEVIIQLGAILAVVSIYLKLLLTNRALWLKLITAFIPTAFVGLFLYDIIKQFLLGSSIVVLWSLFVGGIFLIIWEKFLVKSGRKTITIEKLSLKKALLIGSFQAVSVVPGVSRAAATIIGSMTAGLDRKSAVEFSFLLAVPTMAAATGLDLIKSEFSFSQNEWGLIVLGFIGAFITALLAVKYFIKFVKNHTFVPFGIYRIVLAFLFWLVIIN